MEYHFLHMSDPASAHDAGGADQAKRPIARRKARTEARHYGSGLI
jgi:hypothetical protein